MTTVAVVFDVKLSYFPLAKNRKKKTKIQQNINLSHLINLLNMKSSKFFFTSAVLLVAGSTFSHGITADAVSFSSFSTSDSYSENGINYDSTTGVVTGLDHANLKFDMTLGWTTAENIIYVYDSKSTWGFYTTEDGGLTGNWNGAFWTDGGTVSASTLAEYANDNVVTVTASINTSGTYMYATDTDRTKIYGASGLKSTNGTLADEITINNDVVTAIYYATYTISNASGTWSKTYASDDLSLQISGSKREIKSSSIPDGTIVVGGSSQIFLQTWDNGQDLDIDNDIVLGATTYTESGNGALYNNVGIRFGNDGSNYVTTLTGNLYVVEDAAIKAGGTNAVNINGAVTDKIEDDNGDIVTTKSTLSVTGSGITFGGDVDITGITLNSGVSFSGKTTIGTLSIATANNVVMEKGGSVGTLSFNSSSASLALGEVLSLTNMTVGSTLPNTVSIDFGTDGQIVASQVKGGINFGNNTRGEDGDKISFTVSLTDADISKLLSEKTYSRNLIVVEGANGNGFWNFSDLVGSEEYFEIALSGALEQYEWTSAGLVDDADQIGVGQYGVLYQTGVAYEGTTADIATLIINVPEPSAFGLLAGAGALALAASRRRRNRR